MKMKAWSPEGYEVIEILDEGAKKISVRHAMGVLINAVHVVGVESLEEIIRFGPILHFNSARNIYQLRKLAAKVSISPISPALDAALKAIGRKPYWPCCWIGLWEGNTLLLSPEDQGVLMALYGKGRFHAMVTPDDLPQILEIATEIVKYPVSANKNPSGFVIWKDGKGLIAMNPNEVITIAMLLPE